MDLITKIRVLFATFSLLLFYFHLTFEMAIHAGLSQSTASPLGLMSVPYSLAQGTEIAKEKGHRYKMFLGAKVFACVNHNKLWKILKQMGILDRFTCLLRNLYAGQEATQLDMEQWTGSKLRKEYIKSIYCHPAYSTNMQSE